jgi:GH18 family chitinase
MKDKVDYINRNSLGGAMIWEIGQDDLSEFLCYFMNFY